MVHYIYVIFLAMFFSLPCAANAQVNAAEPAVIETFNEPVSAPQPSAAQKALTKGKSLLESGDLLKAREVFYDMYKGPGLTHAEKQAFQAQLERTNFELMFSKNDMPESVVYEVKPGDSLYVIAREHGTTIDLIKKINGLTRDTIYPKQKLKVITKPFSIFVDKSDNYLTLSLADIPLKTYRVATGRDNNTPVGTFKIINKLENPTWYKAGAVVPPESPDNELGTRWLGFDIDSYGIHGTVFPDSIGKQATAGCVRMLNEEVEELFTMVPAKTVVTITD